MRRHSLFHTRQTGQDLKLTSLIDVVFLLLIFFVWTASFQIAEYVLPSSVTDEKTTAGSAPTDTPPPEADFADVVVRIRWQNEMPAWFINDQNIPSLHELQQRLSAIFAIVKEAPVILHPDPEVPLGNVIELYDVARVVGFDKVQFAANMN